MAHRNEELLRKGYAAFIEGDLAAIRELFAEDIVWHEPGNNPLSGTYKGRDEVFGFLAQVVTLSEGTFSLEVHDILANDTHGVAILSANATRNGMSYNGRSVDVAHIVDGKVVEFWAFLDDQAAADAFWS